VDELEDETDTVRGGDVMLSSKTKCVWCFDFDFDFQEISRDPSSFPFPSDIASTVDKVVERGYIDSLYGIAD
jgi:hypothetical protein